MDYIGLIAIKITHNQLVKIIGIFRLGTSSAYNITHVDNAFSLVNEYGGSTGVAKGATSEIMRLKALQMTVGE